MSLTVYLRMEIDTGGPEPHYAELFTANITHNLANMAGEAGIYEHLWRPGELDISLAGDLIEPLSAGLDWLHSDPGRFEQFNPPNGWGTYEGLVEFVDAYLRACTEHPKAQVIAWR